MTFITSCVVKRGSENADFQEKEIHQNYKVPFIKQNEDQTPLAN